MAACPTSAPHTRWTHNGSVEYLAVLLIGAVALTWGLLAGRRRPPLPVDPQDADELDRLGREVLLEEHLNRAAALVMALTRIHARRVPLAHVDPDPGIKGQGYLRFADSTTILARSSDTGDLGMVASALLLGRVLVATWADDGTAVKINLAWASGSRTVQAVALADPSAVDGE